MATIASAKKSTIVRDILRMTALRTSFRLGSWLLPSVTVRRADRLFSAPGGDSRHRALQADSHGARIETLDWRGERLALYRWGDPTRQPTALFAHGWSSFGLRAVTWLPALRQAGYAVISFDQAGHGRSSGNSNNLPGFADAVATVVRHVGSVDAIVGHSFGGAATMLALADGLRIRRTILIAPPADLSEATQRFARFIGMAEHLVGDLIRRFETRLDVELDQLRPAVRAPAIATPGLIVHDCGDREVPWHEGERYARSWPGARLLTTTGLGHHRILGDPEVVAAGIRFLGGETVGERVVSSPNLPYGLA